MIVPRAPNRYSARMILEIRNYGDPILREPTARIDNLTQEIHQLIDDMLETMRAANGIGLAAPQVGRSVALAVIDMPLDYDTTEDGKRLNPGVEMPLILINPEILKSSRKTDVHEEGCLSFPGIRADIERPVDITLRYQTPEGQVVTKPFTDFLARVIQHEVDHLNGVLFIDRMSAAKRFALAPKIKRLRRITEEKLGIA